MSTINQISFLKTIFESNSLNWERLYSILAAVLVAFTIIYSIAYANPEVIHNAAHDIRHSMIFPCH